MINKEGVTKSVNRLNDIIDKHKYLIEEANNTLKDIKKNFESIQAIPYDKVLQLVKEEIGVDFTIKSRKREIADARFICVYLLKRFTNLSLSKIAKYTGNSNHSTVIKSLRTTSDLMTTDINFRAKIIKLEKELIQYRKQIYGNHL